MTPSETGTVNYPHMGLMIIVEGNRTVYALRWFSKGGGGGFQIKTLHTNP